MSDTVKLVIRPDGNCIVVIPKVVNAQQIEQFRILWDRWVSQQDAAHPLFLVGEVVTVKDFELSDDGITLKDD